MKQNKMKLEYIRFSVAHHFQIKNARYFNTAGTAMGSLFLGNLFNFATDNYFKICIDCCYNLPEKKDLKEPYPQTFKNVEEVKQRIENGTFYYQNLIEIGLNTLTIFRNFNSDVWFKANKLTRKKMMIEEMYYSLLHLANHFNWETQPLHNAYNACIASNYENSWYIKKFTKTSPNRKHIGKVWVEYDVDSFRTFIIITDKQEIILEKKQVHIMDYNDPDVNPLFETDRIFKGTAKWDKDTFILTSDKSKEIGMVKVEKVGVV